MPRWASARGAVAALAIGWALGCTPENDTVATLALDDCDDYCDLALLHCTKANLLYDSADACAQACATFSTAGAQGDTRGNTLQCRLTYVAVAAVDPRPFCANAGPDGGFACQ